MRGRVQVPGPARGARDLVASRTTTEGARPHVIDGLRAWPWP